MRSEKLSTTPCIVPCGLQLVHAWLIKKHVVALFQAHLLEARTCHFIAILDIYTPLVTH